MMKTPSPATKRSLENATILILAARATGATCWTDVASNGPMIIEDPSSTA